MLKLKLTQVLLRNIPFFFNFIIGVLLNSKFNAIISILHSIILLATYIVR